MKKHYSIFIRGREKDWSFNFYADEKYVEDWWNDGLKVYEVVNVVPGWVQQIGMTKPWVFFQDIINFRWLEK